VVGSNGPASVNSPASSVVVDNPACGPSTTSTVAPAMRLNPVSITNPQMLETAPFVCAGAAEPAGETAEAADGIEDGPESPQPLSPWTSARSTIPVQALMTRFLLPVKREAQPEP
jgi:hypothetical protein